MCFARKRAIFFFVIRSFCLIFSRHLNLAHTITFNALHLSHHITKNIQIHHDEPESGPLAASMSRL
jgi:hypothetical protein